MAHRTGGPVVLDGNLSERAWAQAAWSSGFTLLGATDRSPEAQTRFKVAFDDAFLYVGAVLDEPHPEQLRARVKERDGKVHSDDCLEIMLDPDGDRVEYYHFTVNPAGVRYDAELRQAGQVRTLEWDCNWQVATQVGAQQWTAEIAIPLVELGLNERSKGDWAINVTRERKAGKNELSSFVPMTGGFHQPALYARLRLVGAAIDKFLWSVRRPYELHTAPMAGKLVFHGKTHVTNQSGKFRFFNVVPSLVGKSGLWAGQGVPDGLDAGQARAYAFSVPVAEQGKHVLRLALVDRRNAKIVYAVQQTVVDVSYVPIRLRLNRPFYCNSIYATESVAALEMDVEVATPEQALRSCSLRLALKPDGGEMAIVQKRIAKVRRSNAARLPIPRLAIGSYWLSAALVAGDGRVVHETRTRVRVLPKVAHEWRIGPNGVLLHNGKPYLPFGWFSAKVEDMAKPGCPYTAMQSYNSQYYPVEKVRAFLDSVAAAGLYVAIYPYPTHRMMSPASVWGKPLTDKEAEALRLRVRALKDHPGLLAWYMADEPELRPALPDRCRRIREIVADEDPFHPCIMLNDTIAGIHQYADGGDVLMPDPYPCFVKGKAAASPIEKVSKFMAACREAGSGRKGIWVTPQAFNYGDYGRLNNRAPTFTELRNMCYQAVIGGAKGFLWYTYSHCRNYPDLRIGMPFLAREAAVLKSAILAPEQTDAVQIECGDPEHLHYSLREIDDMGYLFAVNTSTVAQQVRFIINRPDRPDFASVLSEDREIAIGRNGAFSDVFEPYAAHIYTSEPIDTGLPTLEGLSRKIAKANAGRKKTGNLAFEDSGVTITYSSKSRYGSTPSRVVDGITDGMRWRDGTSRKLPDWLQLDWPKAVKIGRTAVYSNSMAQADVQVPDGDSWRTVATAAADGDGKLQASFAPVGTKALRIVATKLRDGAQWTTITEVEAYEK